MSDRLFWFLYPTEWIAVLSVVLAGVAIVQAAIYAFMHAANKQIARAYVTMSHRPPGIDFGLIHVRPEGDLRRVAINVRIKNEGNTPAKVTHVHLEPLIGVGQLRETPRYDPDESFNRRVQAFTVKNDEFIIGFEWWLPQPDIVTVLSGTNRFAPRPQQWLLWVFGYVDYIDQFGARHRAGYARVHDPAADDRERYFRPSPPVLSTGPVAIEADFALRDWDAFQQRNNLPFVTQPGYNYDRERLEGEGDDWDDSQKPHEGDS